MVVVVGNHRVDLFIVSRFGGSEGVDGQGDAVSEGV